MTASSQVSPSMPYLIYISSKRFGFITGPREQERLKVQYTARQTLSMADSLTVGLTPC